MPRTRSEADCMTPRDYADVGYSYGHNGESLAACVRGLGIAAMGRTPGPLARRSMLDGFRQGEHDRAMNDAERPYSSEPDDGPIPW